MPRRPASRSSGPPHAVLLPLVAVALVGLAVPTGAQSDDSSPDDAQSELEDARTHIDALDDELALLSVSDADLSARLADLQAQIDVQQAAVDEAARSVAAAESRLADLEVQIETATRWVAEQQELVDERAVAAYMRPTSEGLAVLFESDDYNEFHTMNVLVRHIAEYDRGILSTLVEAKTELAAREVAAEEAREEASRLQAEAEAALADLQDARGQEEAVRAVLIARVTEVHAEVDALEASEAQLVALIEERQRQAEAATTTTAAPTTSPPVGPGPTNPPATSPPATTPGVPAMVWPVSGVVVSGFGPRVHPIDGTVKMHDGIDIDALTGTPIAAAAAGQVYFTGWLGGYGNAVLIDHGDGVTTLYAHQSVIQASEGQWVSGGEVVGLVGSTGYSTGPHLHFEVRIWGVPNDPLIYLP